MKLSIHKAMNGLMSYQLKTSNNDIEGIYIRAGKPRMILKVNYSKNDEGIDVLTVSGNLPIYVLNGVAKLLTMTFTD